MSAFRLLVTGSRRESMIHRAIVHRELHRELRRVLVDCDIRLARPSELLIVHGACPSGVDTYVELWASGLTDVSTEPHPAELFGPWPACGPRRNSFMVSRGADLCLGFPGPWSKGTWDCLKKAVDAGIPTRVTVLPLPPTDEPPAESDLPQWERDLLDARHAEAQGAALSCPKCFAMVNPGDAEYHARWHSPFLHLVHPTIGEHE